MSAADWSNLPADLLAEILKRLDMVTFFHFRAVCVAWRRSTEHRCPSSRLPRLLLDSSNWESTPLPWLLLPSHGSNPEFRHFYDPSKQKMHELRLPSISGHHFFGSSHGFLISVDADANLHATNPLTGAHLPLPPTSTFPGILGALRDPSSSRLIAYLREYPTRPFFFEPPEAVREDLCTKVILSPSADAVVAIHNMGIAFARPGDASWTPLFNIVDYSYKFCMFQDAIFYKGRIHAITHDGKFVVFDPNLLSTAPLFSCIDGPDRLEACSKRYLVEYAESLLLVTRDVHVVKDARCTTDVRIYFLDDMIPNTWIPIPMECIGDLAFFLGFNYSYALNASGYPCLKGNHIYLTEDDNYWLIQRQSEDDIGSIGVEVFNLKDRSKETLYSSKGLNSLNRPPPLWLMPTVK